MNQTRIGSLIEVSINILIGFSINLVANLLILPRYGFAVTGEQAFSMGLIFTAISVVRGYVIRRWFNFGLRPAAIAGGVPTRSQKLAAAGFERRKSVRSAGGLWPEDHVWPDEG